MSGTLGFVAFLDSREKAIAVWLLAAVVLVAIKGDGLGSSFLGVLRTLVAPKVLGLFVAAGLYVATVVFLASELGIWHTSATKATLYWFFGTGVILAASATQASPREPTLVRKLLRRALKLTILVEFLVNLYVFPFAVELLLVPLVFLFLAMQIVAEHREDVEPARKFISGVLGALGLGLLAYVALRALTDPSGLATRENAEDFLVGPALTLALLPFLYLVAWESQRELDKLRRRAASFDDRGLGPDHTETTPQHDSATPATRTAA